MLTCPPRLRLYGVSPKTATSFDTQAGLTEHTGTRMPLLPQLARRFAAKPLLHCLLVLVLLPESHTLQHSNSIHNTSTFGGANKIVLTEVVYAAHH